MEVARAPRERQLGAETVELLLVLPLLLTLLFGAVDGCRLVVCRYMVSYGAVLGGRTASVQNTATDTAVKTAVVNAVPYLGLSTSAVTVSPSGAAFIARAAGTAVTVTVTYSYTPFVPVLSKFVNKTLTGTSQVTVE